MPPPPKEFPFEYKGRKPIRRKLTDGNVIEARATVGSVSCLQLSKKFGVSYKTLWSAVKGLTFKHLNIQYPPQQ